MIVEHAKRRGREIALAGLVQYDYGLDYKTIMSLEWFEEEASDRAKAFAKKLIQGTIENIDKIDNIIKKYLKGWTIERLAYVDRAILRFSVYSFMKLKNIPPKVVINEAIEIAKRFSDNKSPAFINGLLDSVYKNEFKK